MVDRVFMRERPWDESMRDTELRNKLAQGIADIPEVVLRNMEAIKDRGKRERKTRLLEIEASL
jgi:hypothetical protein